MKVSEVGGSLIPLNQGEQLFWEACVIHLKLAPRREVTPEDHDPMGRTWYGWEPGMSPSDVYERNRGDWVLGARADRERLAVFSDTVERRIRCVVEIDHVEQAGGRRALVGTVLGPGNPDHDELINRVAPDTHRNPVTYPPDPRRTEARCSCGCGMPVSERAHFIPGHDQRAVHARIAAQWGTVAAFLEWFDRTYGRPEILSPR